MHDLLTFSGRFLLFAVLHSLAASDPVKRRIRLAPQRYRLCYNIASFLLFGWVMSTGGGGRVLYVVPGAASLLCHLLQLLTLALLFACLQQTGIRAFLGVAPENGRLISSGWYAFVRHPLYFLSLLFLALNPVMTSRWLTLTALAAAYFIVGALIEEQRLLKAYGDAYRTYRERVPFLLPDRRSFSRTPLT